MRSITYGRQRQSRPDTNHEPCLPSVRPVWKFHTLHLREPLSHGVQSGSVHSVASSSPQMLRHSNPMPFPMMPQMSQVAPMMFSQNPVQLPTNVVQGDQQKQNLGPFGMKISNGLVDLGVGMHGANFGMDQKTLRDLMEATANVYGRAGISMGFNP